MAVERAIAAINGHFPTEDPHKRCAREAVQLNAPQNAGTNALELGFHNERTKMGALTEGVDVMAKNSPSKHRRSNMTWLQQISSSIRRIRLVWDLKCNHWRRRRYERTWRFAITPNTTRGAMDVYEVLFCNVFDVWLSE
jgi:hypothetical protein